MYNNSRISLPFLLQKNIPCQVHPQALVHYMVMEGQHGQESSLLERLKYKQQYILSAHTLLLSEKIFRYLFITIIVRLTLTFILHNKVFRVDDILTTQPRVALIKVNVLPSSGADPTTINLTRLKPAESLTNFRNKSWSHIESFLI